MSNFSHQFDCHPEVHMLHDHEVEDHEEFSTLLQHNPADQDILVEHRMNTCKFITPLSTISLHRVICMKCVG